MTSGEFFFFIFKHILCQYTSMSKGIHAMQLTARSAVRQLVQIIMSNYFRRHLTNLCISNCLQQTGMHARTVADAIKAYRERQIIFIGPGLEPPFCRYQFGDFTVEWLTPGTKQEQSVAGVFQCCTSVIWRICARNSALIPRGHFGSGMVINCYM